MRVVKQLSYLVKTHVYLDGIPLHLVDTAGIRSGADKVEQQGIMRALAEIEKSDVILWIKACDAQDLSLEDLVLLDKLSPHQDKIIEVISKIDLNHPVPERALNPEAIPISVYTGQGIEALKKAIKTKIAWNQEEDVFLARTRHIDALTQAKKELVLARVEWQARRHECLAECLKQGHQILGNIVGTFSTEDLLGEIFSSFCIGK